MKKLLLFILLGFFIIPSITFAKSSFLTGDSLKFTDPLFGNTFVLGNNVEIDNTIDGNLYVAAQTLKISGNIRGEAFVLGSEIDISGNIERNLHIAGGILDLSGTVNGSSYIASSFTKTRNTFDAKKDIYGASEQMELDGNFRDEAIFSGNDIKLSGTFYKNLNISSKTLDISGLASIKNGLSYSTKDELPKEKLTNVLGTINYEKQTFVSKTSNYFSRHFGGVLFSSVIFLILFLTLLVPNIFSSIAEIALDNPLRNFTKGFLSLVMWIGFIILFILPGTTILLSMFLALGLVLSFFMYFPIVGFSMIVFIMQPQSLSRVRIFTYAITGSIILILISSIPYIGMPLILLDFIGFVGLMFTWKMKLIAKL